MYIIYTIKGLTTIGTNENITKAAAKYVDGLSVGSENLTPELRAIFDSAECEKLDYVAEEHQVKEVSEFLDKVIDTEVLI